MRLIRFPAQQSVPVRGWGFTLIELLIALAILAVLATMVLPVAQLAIQRQKETELRQALREIRSAIDGYKRAFDQGRIQRGINDTGYPPALKTLVEGVEDLKDPRRNKIYFLRRVPRDPFSDSTSPDAGDTWNKRAYASEATEPKEGGDIYDVASRSPRIGLNGQAYNQW